MTEQEFIAACTEAIKPYFDSREDGPLLASVRPKATFDPIAAGGFNTWEIHPTYAAVLQEWPDSRNGTNYGHYCDEPEEAIEALVRVVKECWQVRQPEPEETDPERLKIDALLA